MVSFREEIIEVLKEAGEPLHYTNISKRVFARGNVKTKGTTPEQSIYVIITLDIKKNGKRPNSRKSFRKNCLVDKTTC